MDEYAEELVRKLDEQDETVEQLARCAVLFAAAHLAEKHHERRLDKAFALRGGRRLLGREVEAAAYVAADHARWRARRISAHRLLAVAMDAWDAMFARRGEPCAEVIDLASRRRRVA